MADGELRKEVFKYVDARKKKQIGTGECFDLADLALKASGAKSAADFGEITKDADYVWGTEIKNLAKIQPGDVLQFRDHKATVKTTKQIKLTFPDGSWVEYESFKERTFKRGHHTAVAASAVKNGRMKVYEQHVKRGRSEVDKTADIGIIYTTNKDHDPQESTEEITIDKDWAKTVKNYYENASDRKWIDQLAIKYKGRRFEAEVVTTMSIKASGKIWAYQPTP